MKLKEANTTLIKIIALLSLIRWYNLLLFSIALYLSALFFIGKPEFWKEILMHPKLHVEVASLNLLMMAGFIINAFYDFEKDIINRPDTTVFGRIISKSFCLNVYVVFVILGVGLSLLVGLKVFVFNVAFSFLLWFYSHKLRKKAFTGELSASVLTVFPFVSLLVFYEFISLTIVLFLGYIFAVSLTREIIKKMVSLKGDLIVGEKSLPIILGIHKTKIIIAFLMASSLVPIGFLFPEISSRNVFYYFILAATIILFTLVRLKPAKTPTQFNKLNFWYKVIIILAVFSIPLV